MVWDARLYAKESLVGYLMVKELGFVALFTLGAVWQVMW
jgi:hypothetical protein